MWSELGSVTCTEPSGCTLVPGQSQQVFSETSEEESVFLLLSLLSCVYIVEKRLSLIAESWDL